MDLQIIDVDEITRVVSFKISPKKISGISKLVQIVVLSLLNSPGRDVLNPEKGAGLPDLVGSNIDPGESTEMFADIAQRVKKSEKEIIEDQVGVDDAPEEKLSEIQIVSLDTDKIDEIMVRIRVVNQAGQASDVVV